MKNIFYILIIAFLISSCNYRIVRSGYKAKKFDSASCEIVIQKNTTVSDSIATKVGEIKLGETGFTTICNEARAIYVLKKEACSINADLIIITKEKRPGFHSTCYRCRAEFYKLNSTENSEEIKSDEAYQPEKIQERVSEDKTRLREIRSVSIGIGIMIGVLLSL